MTDRRRRERSLPKGYQYGDARPPEVSLEGACVLIDGVPHVLRAPSSPPHVHAFERYEPSWDLHYCRCGASRDRAGVVAERAPQLSPHVTANVIEGEHFDSDAERVPVIEGAR